MGGRRAGMCIVAGAALALTAATAGEAVDLALRAPLDFGKFTGLWHEIARTPNRFQDNQPRRKGERMSACYDTTAQYVAGRDGNILVQNSCLRRGRSGAVVRDTVRGVARPVEGSGNRKFQVAFGPGVARFVQRLLKPDAANYRIYCLGPEVGGRHAWAVLGDDGKGGNVFLLARDPSVPEPVKADMTACARKHGLPVDRLISR